MKIKLLLFTIFIFSSYFSFSQSIDIMTFLGRTPFKSESNALADNLMRILYYDIRPKDSPKIGYLNNKGKIVIEPKFNAGTDFYNNYANIIKDSVYGYIDKNGNEVLLKKFDKVFFYYGNTGIAKKNGKYGLINRKGDSLTSFKYNMIDNFGSNYFKGYLGNKKSHVLDEKGNIFFNENSIFDIKSHYFESDSIFIFQKIIDGEEVKGLVDKKGKIISKPKYQKIYFINDDEFYAVKNNKWGFINKLGQETIPLMYDMTGTNINENLIPVMKNGKWGYINRNNEEVIPFIYDEAQGFLNGLAYVKKGDFYGYIDKRNKTKIEFNLENTKYSFFTGKLALFSEEGKYGFINKKGKVVIPAIYDKAFPFINGMAYVELEGKAGYIDKKGKEIIPIKYKQLWFESDGMIRFAE